MQQGTHILIIVDKEGITITTFNFIVSNIGNLQRTKLEGGHVQLGTHALLTNVTKETNSRITVTTIILNIAPGLVGAPCSRARMP